MADLGREALEPRPGERDRLQQLRVPVARHHLGRDRLALQAEPKQDALLEFRRGRRVGADGARDRPDRSLREGSLEPAGVAVGLERETRELDPERRRLGVNAVRTPGAERMAVLACAGREGLHETPAIRQDELGHAPELEREARIEHVARRDPVVDPAAGRTCRLGEHVHERGGVMVRDPLAFGDGNDGEARGADLVKLGESRAGHLLARRNLDLAHRLEMGVVGPDLSQLGPGIAVDHYR